MVIFNSSTLSELTAIERGLVHVAVRATIEQTHPTLVVDADKPSYEKVAVTVTGRVVSFVPTLRTEITEIS